MKNISNESGIDRALPMSVAYLIASMLFMVGVGAIYYGFNDGILHQDLTTWTKSGRIAYHKGIPAILVGVAVTCIGLIFTCLAVFTIKNEKERRVIKGR